MRVGDRRFPAESGKLIAATALGAALLLCLLTLPNDFIWDDWDKISSVPSLSNIPLLSLFSPSYWGKASHEPAETGYYRPAATISFALDNMLWNPSGSNKPAAWHYRFQGIILYVLTVWMVFRIFSTLLGGSVAGGITAFLFAVHPLHIEVISFLSARPDLLSGAFCLVSMSFLFSPSSSGIPGSSSTGAGNKGKTLKPVGVARLLFSVFFFAAAILSKESAVILPVCIIAASMLPGGGGITRILPVIFCDIAILLVYFVLRWWVVGETAPIPDSLPELLHGILLAGQVFLFYTRVSFFPVGLSGDYGFPPEGLREVVFSGISGLVLALLVLSAAFKYRKLCPALPGGTLWFVAALIPASNLLPIPQFQADRYAYFATAGWAALVAGYLSGRIQTGKGLTGLSRLVIIFMFIMGGFLTIISISRVGVWHSELSFWSNVLSHDSSNARGLYNHGIVLEKTGEDSTRSEEREYYYHKALEQYTKAAALNPAAWKIRLTLGELLWKLGDMEGSLNVNEQAARDFSDIPEIQHNFGVSLARTGRYRESERAFTRALELREDYALAYFHRAKILANLEQWTEAALSFEKCLDHDAENGLAAYMLGEIYAIRLGRKTEANAYFKRALALNPPEKIRRRILRLYDNPAGTNDEEDDESYEN